MIKRVYVRRRHENPSTKGTFNPNASFPSPEYLILKIESTLDSCLLIEHVEVAEKFFLKILNRADREGYFNQRELAESAAKLRILVEKQSRVIGRHSRFTV